MSSPDFVAIGRGGSLQSLPICLTPVTFKAEDEDATVAAALLVLLLAPTPPSPLRCRAGEARIMALACGLLGALLSGWFASQLGALLAPLLCRLPLRGGRQALRTHCGRGCRITSW